MIEINTKHMIPRWKSLQLNEDAKRNSNLFVIYFLYLTHKSVGVDTENKLRMTVRVISPLLGFYSTFQ